MLLRCLREIGRRPVRDRNDIGGIFYDVHCRSAPDPDSAEQTEFMRISYTRQWPPTTSSLSLFFERLTRVTYDRHVSRNTVERRTNSGRRR